MKFNSSQNIYWCFVHTDLSSTILYKLFGWRKHGPTTCLFSFVNFLFPCDLYFAFFESCNLVPVSSVEVCVFWKLFVRNYVIMYLRKSVVLCHTINFNWELMCAKITLATVKGPLTISEHCLNHPGRLRVRYQFEIRSTGQLRTKTFIK